jgi:hypothetical protein
VSEAVRDEAAGGVKEEESNDERSRHKGVEEESDRGRNRPHVRKKLIQGSGGRVWQRKKPTAHEKEADTAAREKEADTRSHS